MAKYSNRRTTTGSAMLICIEALTVSISVLVIITFVAGRYHDHLRGLSMLTFDTSSVNTHLANHGISNASNVRDWYEPHYLSVCKGMWQSTGTHLKNEAFTVCTAMKMGYTFSLPELLAADAGLPSDSPLFSTWAFAVLQTRLSSVCLVLTMTLINWAILDYTIAVIVMCRSKAESSIYWLKQGLIPSIPVLIVLILLAAEVTARMHKILGARTVLENGVAWSTGGFYVLTWLATGLTCLMVTLSVVLFFKLRQPSTSPKGELGKKSSG